MADDKEMRRKIRAAALRRLRLLELKQAELGPDADPSLTTQIEDLRLQLGIVDAVRQSPTTELFDALGPGAQTEFLRQTLLFVRDRIESAVKTWSDDLIEHLDRLASTVEAQAEELRRQNERVGVLEVEARLLRLSNKRQGLWLLVFGIGFGLVVVVLAVLATLLVVVTLRAS